MQRKSVSFVAVSFVLFSAALFVTAARASERQERVVHSFGVGKDGNQVNASLVLDAASNLYGTTTGGGAYNSGTVYKLSFQAVGGWQETRLHDFGKGNDGAQPCASVTLDPTGNLFGTAISGGTYGLGAVFELTPNIHGGWTEKVLYSFNSTGSSGYSPGVSLVLDASGNLYGTTRLGGAYGQGTVFELSPSTDGVWAQQILHSFNSGVLDGVYPVASVTFDAAGHLYGTTSAGGTRGGGTVFQLSSTTAGWTEKVLHSFDPNGTDGFSPYAGVVLDSTGNLYGTTPNGGSNWVGVVYKLAPGSNGHWTETILHSFRANGIDGTSPFWGVTLDTLGNLYGTTTDGGAYSNSGNSGTVYEVIP